MTVETLLKQLEDERTAVMASMWQYGSRAIEARDWNDIDYEDECRREHDKCYDKWVHLSMLIKEIKKRVS